ncbi:MAG: sulfurtransferase [Flavobacteriaceae bacterium]
MKLKISFFIFCLFFLSCKQKESSLNIGNVNPLIEFDELQKIISAPNLKIIDFRKPNLYNEGHLENALNIWRDDIENKNFPYKGMMANKSIIEKLLSRLGIHENDLLVIYDDNGLCDAARLWWVLENYGHTNTRLLNGGYSNWLKQKGAISKKTTKPKVSHFKFTGDFSKELFIIKEDVLSAAKKKALIIDTRTPDEYSGKRQKKGAFKGGRIPNSISIDWTLAINYHGDKKIKPIAELEKIYSSYIKSKEDTIIVYCHSGVRSAHTTFVLSKLLGYNNVKNYDGSWTEWSYFNDLPFHKDSITSIKN